MPSRASAPDSAIEKHAAWAAATSSSGLVLPSEASVRADHDTGRSAKAPDDMADTVPEPVVSGPDQRASARRMAAIESPLLAGTHRPTWVARAVPCGPSRSGGVVVDAGRSGARTNAPGDRDGLPITSGRAPSRPSTRAHRPPPPRAAPPRRDARGPVRGPGRRRDRGARRRPGDAQGGRRPRHAHQRPADEGRPRDPAGRSGPGQDRPRSGRRHGRHRPDEPHRARRRQRLRPDRRGGPVLVRRRRDHRLEHLPGEVLDRRGDPGLDGLARPSRDHGLDRLQLRRVRGGHLVVGQALLRRRVRQAPRSHRRRGRGSAASP